MWTSNLVKNRAEPRKLGKNLKKTQWPPNSVHWIQNSFFGTSNSVHWIGGPKKKANQFSTLNSWWFFWAHQFSTLNWWSFFGPTNSVHWIGGLFFGPTNSVHWIGGGFFGPTNSVHWIGGLFLGPPIQCTELVVIFWGPPIQYTELVVIFWGQPIQPTELVVFLGNSKFSALNLLCCEICQKMYWDCKNTIQMNWFDECKNFSIEKHFWKHHISLIRVDWKNPLIKEYWIQTLFVLPRKHLSWST